MDENTNNQLTDPNQQKPAVGNRIRKTTRQTDTVKKRTVSKTGKPARKGRKGKNS
jgi:hypothetical protein